MAGAATTTPIGFTFFQMEIVRGRLSQDNDLPSPPTCPQPMREEETWDDKKHLLQVSETASLSSISLSPTDLVGNARGMRTEPGPCLLGHLGPVAQPDPLHRVVGSGGDGAVEE